MDPSRLLLSSFSPIVLAFLIVDAWRRYGRRWVFTFIAWGVIYAILRANSVAWIVGIVSHTNPSLPYQVNQPFIQFFGASLQEIIGWLIVALLGWRLSSFIQGLSNVYGRLFLSAIFIGCVSYAVETTAIEADWWKWEVVLGSSIFGRVPFIGILDWSMVALDFLTPFILFHTPKASTIIRIFSLIFFPLHMVAHLHIHALSPIFPFSGSALAHYGLFLFLLVGSAFAKRTMASTAPTGLSIISLYLMMGVLVLIDGVLLKMPYLLISLLPLGAFHLLTAKSPFMRYAPLLFLTLAPLNSPLVPVAFPALALALMLIALSGSTLRKIVVLAISFIMLYATHWRMEKSYSYFNALKAQVMKHYQAGDFKMAKEYLKKVFDMKKSAPFMHFLMGNILRSENRFNEAISEYKMALHQFQFHADGVYALLDLYLQLKKYDEAFNLWKRAIKFHQKDPRMHFLGFQILNAKGLTRQGEKELYEVIRWSDAEHSPLLHLNALVYLKQEHKAEKRALSWVRLYPMNEQIVSFLDDYYRAKGRERDRIELFRSLVQRTGYSGYVGYLAHLAEEEKDVDTQLFALKIMARLSPDNKDLQKKIEELEKKRGAFNDEKNLQFP